MPSASTLHEPSARGSSTHQAFWEDGFTAIADLVPRELAVRAGERARELIEAPRPLSVPCRHDERLHQVINVWRADELLRSITFYPRLLEAVNALAGEPMRLWHDQLFRKTHRDSAATEWHQDLPYWPVPEKTATISAWIALGDVPEDGGCLSFIPGSHRLRGAASDLGDPNSLMAIYPELRYRPRVTLPMPAGGCTLHQGYCAHRAGANRIDRDRIALSVIWVPIDTRVTSAWHILRDAAGLVAGKPFPDAFCPRI